MNDVERASAILTIDLDAVAENYRRLSARSGAAECAAMVKANAYGVGIDHVAPAIARAGCHKFFTASLDEAVRLRTLAPEIDIAVLNGVMAGEEETFDRHRLVPVLNDLGQIERWARRGLNDKPRAAIIHLDTGMCRLGLPPDEVDRLADEPARLDGLDLRLVMSHLACAEDPAHAMNEAQRKLFEVQRARLPAAPASLANSAGIFFGAEYHLDMVRPGIALYGSNPLQDAPNPMVEVVRLQSKITQLRDVDSPQTVGYGAAHRVAGPGRIATVPVGYADGYLRSLSGRAFAAIGDTRVPLVGRVSMDLITLDVSTLPPGRAEIGTTVDLIGGPCPIDEVAGWAGSIANEFLTGLGSRYARRYVGEGT